MRVELDGRPADVDGLLTATLVNYGHYTSMQVRDGRTRGLGLHLERLSAATAELFDAALDPDLVRDRIRHALDGEPEATVRAGVFEHAGRIAMLVSIRPPLRQQPRPTTLMSVSYQRPAAHLKHVGTFGQTYYGRQAVRRGFDDALLTGPDGVISESAIANIAFSDGAGVVWPRTPALPGITMQLLQTALPAAGVRSRQATARIADLQSYAGAFVTNSIGIAPVTRVDELALPVDAALLRTLGEVYDALPWDPV